MTETQVKIVVNNRHTVAQLTFEQGVILLKTEGQEWSASDEIPFLALKKLRLDLEKMDVFILVNGCRKDVYPSGMQMDMRTTGAYILTMGQTGGEVVDIFDECDDIQLISTTDEQEQFHLNWVRSIA